MIAAIYKRWCFIWNHGLGQAKGQQTWEALIVLVAMKAWTKLRNQCRSTSSLLGVKGDNITALTMTLKFKATPGNVLAIARELALVMTESTFEPVVYEHVPGIASVVADELSRRWDPKYKDTWTLPDELKGVPHTAVPALGRDYYALRPR